jgi:hypothetical protein
MTYLINTYSFIPGDVVKAIVRARNSNGYGGYSSLNINGGSIKSVPA